AGGRTKADPDKPLEVTATGRGRLTDVVAVDASGRRVAGELSADGTRWRAARVAVNTPEGPVELTAAHVLRNEDTTLADFRLGLIGAVTLAFLCTAGLGYLLLRRGLAPLRRIARHAGGIT
uniref:Ig-like domain-containing protein n=1 Tax=Streptomyces sp. CHD11 TaxID=2741325 RepID=UPI0020421183